MSLTFYTNPMSRGRIIRWMLEESGASYDTTVVEYGARMKDAGYRAINPMGKVPAIDHNGKIVTECPAICAYLADTFTEANLAPAINDRADYYRWLFFAAGPLESAITMNSMDLSIPEDKQGMVGFGNYALTIDVLESMLSNRQYIAANRFTAADVYVGSHIGFGLQFGSL